MICPMRETIIAIMSSIADDSDLHLKSELHDQDVLLECGLDSLGFAILVAHLEEEFGYDPFSLMDQPYYPRTFGEFVAIYQKYAP